MRGRRWPEGDCNERARKGIQHLGYFLLRFLGGGDLGGGDMMRIVHFVGFRDDRYWNAVKVFGPPHYIHPRWDACARRELDDGDLVVFADDAHEVRMRNFRKENPDFERLMEGFRKAEQSWPVE